MNFRALGTTPKGGSVTKTLLTGKNRTMSYAVSDDDNVEIIDLKKVAKAIWHDKWVIFCFVVLALILGTAYIASAQKWWRAESTITLPQVSEMASYRSLVKSFQPSYDVRQEDGKVLVGEELEPLIDSENVFIRFVALFDSEDSKYAFLLKNAYLNKSLSINNEMLDEEELRIASSVWFNKIKMTRLSEYKYLASAKGVSKEQSEKILNDYMDYVSYMVTSESIVNLRSMVDTKKQELERHRDMLFTIAENRLSSEIELVRRSIRIAEKAGVDTPLYLNESIDQKFSISLGVKGLKEKHLLLKEIEDMKVIEPKIGLIDARISLLEWNDSMSKVSFRPYSELEATQSSQSAVKPNKLMVWISSILLGLVIGLIFSIVRNK